MYNKNWVSLHFEKMFYLINHLGSEVATRFPVNDILKYALCWESRFPAF